MYINFLTLMLVYGNIRLYYKRVVG